MRLVRRVFFLLTLFQAYVSSAAGLMVLNSIWSTQHTSGTARLALILLAQVFCYGALANAIASWRMRKGPTRWLYAACVLNLACFPLGTALGTVGLCLLTRRSFREADPTPLHAARIRKTSDGANWLLQQLLGFVPFAVAAPFAYFGWQWANAAGLPSQPLWYWVLSSQLAFLASTFVHECGHVICGWLSDFRLMRFSVGPFHLEKPQGHWRMRYDVTSPAGPGEPRGMAPLHWRRIRTRALFYIAGGPLASLTIAAATTFAFLASPDAPWREVWPFLQSAMAVAWAQALLNLIPLSATGYSDCAFLKQLRHPGGCEEFFADNAAR